MNILIADDDRTNLKLLRAQLEGEGHAVHDAADGLEALAVLERQPIDAIISDILMPRMDGYRLCYEVRKNKRFQHLPLIVYTATYTSPGDEKLALDVGADKYLRKPSPTRVIVAMLEQACGLPQDRHHVPNVFMSEAEVMREYSERLVLKLEHKNVELAAAVEHFQASEERLRAIVQTEPECVKIVSPEGHLLEMNPAGLAMIEAESLESAKRWPLLDYISPGHRPAFIQLHQRVMRGETGSLVFEIVGLKGTRRWLDTHAVPLRDKTGKITSLLGITRDITRNKEAEEALNESRRQLTTLVSNLPGLAYRCLNDDNFTTQFVSDGVAVLSGFPAADFIEHRRHFGQLVHPDDQEAIKKQINAALEQNRPFELTYRIRNAAGEIKWVWEKGQGVRGQSGEVRALEGFVTEITEQKKAEAYIRQLNRVYSVLSEINETIVRVKDSREMLQAACRIAVENGGFLAAWIGLAHSPPAPLEIAAHAGADEATIQVIKSLVNGPGPDCVFTAEALRTGRHSVSNDIDSDSRADPWRQAAAQRGYRAMCALPLKVGECVIGTFNLYAAEPGCFVAEELRLLDELAMDISFALEVAQQEARRRAAEERLAIQRNELIALTGKLHGGDGDLLSSLRLITETAARTLQSARVSVWRYHCDRSVLECATLFDQATATHSAGARLTIATHREYFRALNEEEVIAAADARNDPRTSEFAADYLRPLGISSLLDVPISVSGIRDGVLCHERTGPARPWTEDEKNFAVAMANLVSLTIEEAERRKAEMELRWRTAFFEAQVDSALDGILVVDRHGRKILQNQRMTELWNIPPHVAQDPNDAVQVEYASRQARNPEEFAKRVAHLYAHPDEISRDIIELIDGKVLERTSFPVRDRAGTHYGRIWIFHEITERRHLEAQLRQAQKMEGIGQLAGGVAHDFNNILSVMLMQAELVAMLPNLPAEALEGLHQIRAAAERAANLTRQLLLFSRKQVMQRRALDLNEVVTGLAKMLQRIIGEDIRLQLNLNPRPLVAVADAGMLDQVLMNLVVNARDAMPEGGKLVIETLERTFSSTEVTAMPGASPGRHICLRVSDTGSGIAPENLSRIFEPFFTTKEPGKGTGLGLATVFGIARQHGGWVSVESELGKGTAFEVFLPAPDTVTLLQQVSRTEKPRGGTETILLVEDESPVRSLTRAVLERHGYRVLEAAHGREALTLWNEHQAAIQMLFTDMIMPEGINGRDLASRLRATNPALAVIFTSGYSAEIAERGLTLEKRQRFIQKPAQPYQVLEAVRQCLDEQH